MPKTSVYVNGRSLSVDNQTFNVKFNKSISDLQSGLSKAQKALGLFYNQNQRLNDVMGRCVEGLSMWQLRLGMWIDETGRARAINGGFVEGLSRTELELGYYVDELGKVYKRTGEFVRMSDTFLKAEKEKEEALYRTREAFADSFDAIGDGLGRFSALIAQLDKTGLEANFTNEQIAKFVGSLDVASQTLSAIQGIESAFENARLAIMSMNAAMSASTTTAQGLKAALATIGGPWTLIATGVAAAASAFFLFNQNAKETEDLSIDGSFGEKVSDSFKEITRRAKEAGDEIRGVADVLKYGAFYKGDVLGLDELEKKIEELNRKKESLEAEEKKTREAAFDSAKYAGYAAPTALSNKQANLQNQIYSLGKALEPLEAQYNEIATDLIKKLREEQKTEEEKADELKKQYKNLLKYAESDEDRAAIERKIKSIDDDIAESKAKELADQQKRLADQRDALSKELGISLDFSAVQTEADRLAADLQRLRDARNDGLIESEEDLKEAERRLAEKYSEARYADWLSSADSLDRLSEITEELAGEQEKGVLSQETYNKILADAAAKEQELVDAKLEAIPGLKALIDANDAEKKAAEDYAKALKIAEEYSEESPFDKGDVFSQEQLDILKNGEDETLRSAMIEYASAMEAAAQGLEDEVIDRETYDELVNRANDNLAKATDALEHEPDNSKEFQPPNKN